MKSILAALTLTLLAASGVSAQQRLTIGQAAKSHLDKGSMVLRDSTFFELYRYDSPGNETIELTMSSTDFDTYVIIGRMNGNAFERLGADDDSGDGTDSKLTLRLEDAGTYYIRANTDNAGETGSYSLRITREGFTGSYPGARPIAIGDRVTGTLTTLSRLADDNTHYDPFLIPGTANTTISVVMESDDFDAYLVIGRPGEAFETLESDDDSAGGTNARLIYTFTDSGTYEIRANTLSEGETGDYLLTVEEGPEPPPSPSTELLRVIDIDSELTGTFTLDTPTLDDDSHFEDIVIYGVPNASIVIRLLSEDFDSYLELGRFENGDFASIEINDDCVENDTNSCITFTFEDDGVYVIRTNTLSGGETGNFQLTVTRRD